MVSVVLSKSAGAQHNYIYIHLCIDALSIERFSLNVLITSVSGAVALFALQFAVAAGAHAYVTSSSSEKIEKATKLGTKGGVNYKDENCTSELKKLFGKNLYSLVCIISK